MGDLDLLRAVLIEGLVSKFPDFVSRFFFACPYFPIPVPNIGIRSVPNTFPSVKFPHFGNVYGFSCFSCFWKKKRKIWKKSCSIRTALRPNIVGEKKKQRSGLGIDV